jgi:hypothetical protein
MSLLFHIYHADGHDLLDDPDKGGCNARCEELLDRAAGGRLRRRGGETGGHDGG